MTKPSSPKQNGYDYLPGDFNKQEYLEGLIRVNHAGEYGAKRIYAGQLAVLKNKPCGKEIAHMAEQEEAHLAFFTKEMQERHVRPTVLMPLWHVLGYGVGAATALLGEKAAMACTVAVEETIDQHYKEQLRTLKDEEPELTDKIEQFRQEELEHRDIGLEHEAASLPGYSVLKTAITLGSKAAIWLSKRA